MAGKRIVVFALLALVAVAFALSARGGAEAQTFKPFNSYGLVSTAPGANSDSTIGFGIAAPDYNYEDASMTMLNPPDGISATGLEAPIGARVGTLSALATVALIGGQCNSALTPNFILKNSSVDIADELTDTSWILKPAATVPVPDTDGDGLFDYEEKYPWFLNDMLDPDGSGPLLPLQPRARFAGHTSVAGFNVIVQFVLFSPGQLAAAGGIYTQMDAAHGAPSWIVLDNPVGEGEASPGAIGDFCTPLTTTTTLYGVTQDNPLTVGTDESGYVRQTNPAASTGVLASGTHMGYNFSQSERNFDADIIENDLDGCRYTTDPLNWNPRVGPPCVAGSNPGDQDCDSLPSSCDSAAFGGNDTVYNNDQDGDGYDNAQDNCPLTDNGCKDSSCGPIFNAAWDNQDDTDAAMTNTDLGPRTDAIGDACDDSDDDGNEDGAGAGTCNDGIDNGGGDLIDDMDPDCTAAMDKADPPANAQPHQGTYYHGYPWDAACVGGTDADNDGYCEALETALGSSDANGPETGAECNDAVDGADGDGVINDGCPYTGKRAEVGAECLNAINDDAATDPNDGGKVNDGCPVIGVPESLVIDATITAASALPTATAPQSCSDGIDNDGDTTIDAADNTALGCNPAHASYASDADKDGVADGSDNCPSVWNPTQTNTDSGFAAVGSHFPAGDTLGDACDTDDDADGFTDTVEAHLPTDPLDRCTNGAAPNKSDAWGLDQDKNKSVTVVGDVLPYSGNIGASVSGSPPTSWTLSRLDLDGNRTITVVGDVLKYSGRIGAACT